MISRRRFNGSLLTLAAATTLGKPEGLFGLGLSDRFEPLPPDVPLPALSTAKAAWTRDAQILQPWGKTQYLAFTKLGDRPERLKKKFGFNVLMAMPATAHNAITPAQYHLTEEQWQEAIAAFRHAGYTLMLYSSIMHCGHAPQWQSGVIEREHPDWSQVDFKGNRVTDYGHAWICPNSPGLEYTLHYAQGLVKKYHPEAIMLDDNGFYQTNEGGWSCYCQYCRERFRNYVLRRCGSRWLKSQLGLKADAIEIPIEKGPLYALWLHWRNRVWARADEVFRKGLRLVDPSIVLFANTLYDYPTAEQSSDLQYDHEDVVFSESHFSNSWYMSEKMLYGKAVAVGQRPLWNYVATFEDAEYSRLRPPEVALPMLAVTLAHGSRPWIVYYGFHQAVNELTLQGMASMLSWYASNPQLFKGEVWAPVAALVSSASRNVLNQPLFPPHVSFLLQHGVPLGILRDEHASARTLTGFRFLTAQTCGVMVGSVAEALATWVKAGGHLIAHSAVAAFDGTGRRRPHSLLWESLGFDEAPKAGRGQVTVVKSEQIGPVALAQIRALAFGLPPEQVEVVTYRQARRILLHVVRHRVIQGQVEIDVPEALFYTGTGLARWYQPGQSRPTTLEVSKDGNGVNIAMAAVPPYSVIELEN